jgi:hypothetical protein
MIKSIFALNPMLAWLGTIHFALALALIIYYPFNDAVVMGINSVIKPIKFALSLGVYAWTMALILPYIASEKGILIYSIMAVSVMGFEQIVITVQAMRGAQSHFNTSPVGAILFGLMGLAIAILTIWTLVLGIRSFWVTYADAPALLMHGIRWGIIVFALAGFLGYYMGANMSHTVGGADGGSGLPFVNWSTLFGDVRVAHFFGLHALQLFPLAGYLLANSQLSAKAPVFYAIVFVYTAYVVFVAVQAFVGRPFIALGS